MGSEVPKPVFWVRDLQPVTVKGSLRGRQIALRPEQLPAGSETPALRSFVNTWREIEMGMISVSLTEPAPLGAVKASVQVIILPRELIESTLKSLPVYLLITSLGNQNEWSKTTPTTLGSSLYPRTTACRLPRTAPVTQSSLRTSQANAFAVTLRQFGAFFFFL